MHELRKAGRSALKANMVTNSSRVRIAKRNNEHMPIHPKHYIFHSNIVFGYYSFVRYGCMHWNTNLKHCVNPTDKEGQTATRLHDVLDACRE